VILGAKMSKGMIKGWAVAGTPEGGCELFQRAGTSNGIAFVTLLRPGTGAVRNEHLPDWVNDRHVGNLLVSARALFQYFK
jgi:hypothetical protein